MSSKLYIGGLSPDVGESRLNDLFAEHEAVESAHVTRNTQTARSQGFGFVEMATSEKAAQTIDSLNGSKIDGRTLTVRLAMFPH